jgi:hypothetical protein
MGSSSITWASFLNYTVPVVNVTECFGQEYAEALAGVAAYADNGARLKDLSGLAPFQCCVTTSNCR